VEIGARRIVVRRFFAAIRMTCKWKPALVIPPVGVSGSSSAIAFAIPDSFLLRYTSQGHALGMIRLHFISPDAQSNMSFPPKTRQWVKV